MALLRNPSMSLLVKLGSALRHVEEMLSPGGHDFDAAAVKSILADPEVKRWMKQMDDAALLPVKRSDLGPSA